MKTLTFFFFLRSMQLYPMIVYHRIIRRIKLRKFYQRAVFSLRVQYSCINSVWTMLNIDWNLIRGICDLDFKPEMWWIIHCYWTPMLQKSSAEMLNCKVIMRPSSVKKMYETMYQQQLLLMLLLF